MRFPVLTGGTERRLSIPVASGGMNIAESADAIADNQLQRAINLWMKEGRLRSRPVVQPTEGVVLRHSHDDQSL